MFMANPVHRPAFMPHILENNKKTDLNNSFVSTIPYFNHEILFNPTKVEIDVLSNVKNKKCPKIINRAELPPELQEFNQIQKDFMNFNSENETITEKLVNFIENNPTLGLRELDICINIRPKNTIHYLKLYLKLSKKCRLIAIHTINFSRYFRNELLKHDPSNFFEANSYLKPNNFIINRIANKIFDPKSQDNFVSKYDREKNVDVIEKIVNDDSEYFAGLIGSDDFNIDTVIKLNKQCATLIQFFALYGAVNCFKTFKLNKASLENIEKFAVAGGNSEIIRILMQSNINFKTHYVTAIEFRQDDMYNWIMENTEEDDPVFSISTITLSIPAMYSLTQTNTITDFTDFIVAAHMDGHIEMAKYFAKFTKHTKELFYFISDENILSIFLERCTAEEFKDFLLYGIDHRAIFHLKLICSHSRFTDVTLDMGMMKSIENKLPEIYSLIIQRTDVNMDAKKVYELINNGHPIATRNILPLIMYCIDINNFKKVAEYTRTYFKELSLEQYVQIAELCPFVSNTFISFYNIAGKTNDILKLIVRYTYNYSKDSIKKLVRELNNNKELLEMLTPFDMLNVCDYMIYCPKEVQDILIQKGILKEYIKAPPNADQLMKAIKTDVKNALKQGLSSWNAKSTINSTNPWKKETNQPRIIRDWHELSHQPSVFKSREEFDFYQLRMNDEIPSPIWVKDAERVKEIHINSDSFKEYFEKNYNNAGHYLYNQPQLLKLYENKTIGKELFNILIKVFIHDKSTVDCDLIIKILTSNENRHFLDIKELAKSEHNMELLGSLPLTKEEFDYLKQFDKFMKSAMFNPMNYQYFTAKILEKMPSDNVAKALTVVEITDDIIEFLKSDRALIFTDYTNIERIYKCLPVATLVAYICKYNHCIQELFDEVFSKCNDSALINKMIRECGAEALPLFKNYLNRMTLDSLIVLTLYYKEMFVSRDTDISIGVFKEAEQIYRGENGESNVEFLIANFSKSKATLTHALYLPLTAKSIKTLVQNGAYLDAVINGQTPLQYAVTIGNEQQFLDAGADIGYHVVTFFQFLRKHPNAYNKYAVNLLNNEYELRYSCSFSVPSKQTRVDLLIFAARMIYKDKYKVLKLYSIYDWLSHADSMIYSFLFIVSNISKYDAILREIGIAFQRHTLIGNVFTTEQVIEEHCKESAALNNVYCVLNSINSIVYHAENTDLLFLATRIGNIDVIRALLENGAKINDVEGYYFLASPSLEAVCHDKVEILQLFLEHGLNPNQIYAADDTTLLNASIRFGAVNCFNVLVGICKLDHVVTLSPMSVALMQYQKGNTYFADTLLQVIDKVLERIESPNFVNFEKCLKDGTQFEFKQDFMMKHFPFNEPKYSKGEYHIPYNIPDTIPERYVGNESFAYNISHGAVTNHSERISDYSLLFEHNTKKSKKKNNRI